MAEKKKAEQRVFESPLPEYPGRIGFPKHLTGGVYRRYAAVMARIREELVGADERPDELLRFGVVVEEISNADPAADAPAPAIRPAMYSITKWRLATALMTMAELENVPEGWRDPSGEETPVTVMAWAAECVDAWLTPLLTLKK